MKTILILFMLTGLDGGLAMQEFNTKEACVYALTKATKSAFPLRGWCVPKGEVAQ